MEPSDERAIGERIAAIRERIGAAAGRAGRNSEEIRLIGVTKTVEAERVAAAFRVGLRDFGENYVQEAQKKVASVAKMFHVKHDAPDWHFIGRLQSNKAKYAVDLFSVVHTVDSRKLAEEIARQAAKRGKIQSVLLEVNLARDPARAGVLPEDALSLAERVAALPSLALAGLMGMAPFSADPEDSRPHFRALRQLYDRLPDENQHALSMGMSGDLEIAIEEGATMVRIGTAIFGDRSQVAGRRSQ